MKVTGLILVIVGALILAYQGFTYTQTKQDAKIGSLTIEHQEHKFVYLPPLVGGICLVAGAVVLVGGMRRA